MPGGAGAQPVPWGRVLPGIVNIKRPASPSIGKNARFSMLDVIQWQSPAPKDMHHV
ncbi:hypothetical protein XC_1294 [Xanthomonas campestris pv. campestris str. 8004]|uniref:Uncharacterized protein n=1 Tax=Xanthomonas campestris pv. campestris (strain 8004) TaxID=314565 RepID=A0A0H2X746_XANC8|nr:hypothetical protein XC_1294 [Xanthomonas campestris pv. campestris str. 8004]